LVNIAKVEVFSRSGLPIWFRVTTDEPDRMSTEDLMVPATVCCRRKGEAVAKEARVRRLRNFMLIVVVEANK
jgi:hypothetical protein